MPAPAPASSPLPVLIVLALLSGVKIRPIVTALAAAAAILLTLAALRRLRQRSGFGALLLWSVLDNSSGGQHLLTIEQGLAMFLAHPLFGAGLGAYMADQLSTTGVPLLIHSTAVWLLAETGLVGFAVFALPDGKSSPRPSATASTPRGSWCC